MFIGQTPTGQKLNEILNKYMPRVENRNVPNRPITIVVITDGVPSSCAMGYCDLMLLTPVLYLADDPKQVIIDAARRLDHRGVPENQLGIQFVQIGDDPDAAEALNELDSGIAAVNGIRVRIFGLLFENKSADRGHRTWWIQLRTILETPNSRLTL